MRAILLAAGFGTRLRPLTNDVPKCLVPIKGQALLGIWLKRLAQAQVGPCLVTTHYLPDLVSKYIATSPYCDQVKLCFEPELNGTAGTLIKNLDFFSNEDGLLIHADNYCLADFAEFLNAHRQRPKGCLLTMMTFKTSTPASCGIVELDESDVVIGFHEKVFNPPGNLANGAVYILSAELLKILASEFKAAKDFSTEVLPKFVGRIFTYETNEVFMDIGTPESYESAQRT